MNRAVMLRIAACGAMGLGAGLLIAARLAQGLGAALFMPSSLALLVRAFPEPRRRASMLALWSAMVAASGTLGPTLGGLLTSAFGWRSIFLVNIPVVAAGVALTLRAVEARPGTGLRINPVGNLLVFLTAGSGAYALIQGNATGFSAGSVRAALGILAVSAVLLVVQQRLTPRPVMPWGLFRRRAFTGANLVGFLYSGALFGNLYLMGLFFQNARHASPLAAGVQFLPMTICFPLANLGYGRLHHRVSDATIMGCCLGVAGLATLALTAVTPATPYAVIAVALGLANSGAGLVTASMTAATVRAAGDEHAGHAGAVLNTNRQFGVLLGVAAIGLTVHGAADWTQALRLGSAGIALAYLCASAAAFTLVPSRSGASAASDRRTTR